MTLPKLAVIVPTLRRPKSLVRAIESVFAQKYAETFEVIIADNDPDAGAQSATRTLISQAPSHITIKYVHVPVPGVSNARNAALEKTSAELIAFLDDDQSAPTNWLSALLAHHETYECSVTFCGIETILPNPDDKNAEFLSRFFSRKPGHKTGYIDVYYGCGNSLLDLTKFPDISPLFDTAMNDSGGEDDVLFGKIKDAGGKFGWTEETVAFEHVPASRASLNYTLKRAFVYGQGPISEARLRIPTRWDLVFIWMLIGGLKTGYNSAAFGMKWLLRDNSRINNLDQMAQGLGKVLWWKRLNFYGQSHVS